MSSIPTSPPVVPQPVPVPEYDPAQVPQEEPSYVPAEPPTPKPIQGIAE